MIKTLEAEQPDALLQNETDQQAMQPDLTDLLEMNPEPGATNQVVIMDPQPLREDHVDLLGMDEPMEPDAAATMEANFQPLHPDGLDKAEQEEPPM